MSWRCYTCGAKNPNSADTCSQCGGITAAPRSFYFQWVLGSAIFFFIVYVAGTFFGGTLIEVATAPTNSEVFKIAVSSGATGKSFDALTPEEKNAAKQKAVTDAKNAMPVVTRYLIFWFLPMILLFLFGGIVGFMSDGRTIIEAGIGSVIGQLAGYCLHRFAFGSDPGIVVIGIVLVVGALASVFGAWIGETLQGRRENAA